jgi:hypothetical protein
MRVADGLANSQMARRFPLSGQPDYMGDFILSRRYLSIPAGEV